MIKELAAGLSLTLACGSAFGGIVVDGDDSDWADISTLNRAPGSYGIDPEDLVDVRVTHDDTKVYMLLSLRITDGPVGGWPGIAIDADNNPDSGCVRFGGTDLWMILRNVDPRISLDSVTVSSAGCGPTSPRFTDQMDYVIVENKLVELSIERAVFERFSSPFKGFSIFCTRSTLGPSHKNCYPAAYTIQFNDYIASTSLPDINGNSAPEVAAMRLDPTGRAQVIVKDSASNQEISRVRFLSENWKPIDLTSLDVDGDGVYELAVTAVNKSNERVQTQIRRALTGQLVRNVTLPTQ